jgi:DNA-binding GntR family transcriptional regulator
MRVPQSAQTRPFRETATLAFSPSRSGVGRALVLRKLSRAEPLGEQAAHSLRMALRRGALQPGQRLTTREVATMLGVSLTPAREVLNRLTAERVLEQTPERVAMVPILTRARHQELCAVRLNLEGMAAKAACQRLSLDDASHLEELYADQQERAIEDSASGCHGADFWIDRRCKDFPHSFKTLIAESLIRR